MAKIARALLSASDKTGLVDFAKGLAAHGVELVSTGGTAKTLRDAGLKVVDVAEITGVPEMMDGRVKTLHPKIHGGLLAVRGEAAHERALAEHAIPKIDLLAVTLYPFEKTVEGGAGEELGTAHHPVEMAHRYGLGLGDAMSIDIEGHAIFHALGHETLHRLTLVIR